MTTCKNPEAKTEEVTPPTSETKPKFSRGQKVWPVRQHQAKGAVTVWIVGSAFTVEKVELYTPAEGDPFWLCMGGKGKYAFAEGEVFPSEEHARHVKGLLKARDRQVQEGVEVENG